MGFGLSACVGVRVCFASITCKTNGKPWKTFAHTVMLQCSRGYCTEINLLLYNLKRSLSTGCCVKCRASEGVQPLQFWMAAELPVNPCHGAVAKKLCFQGCWSLDGCCKHFAILMALRVNKPIICDTFRESMQLPYPLIYHNRPYDSSCI